MQHELLCTACVKARDAGQPIIATSVCRECLAYVTDEVGDLVGARGQPEIRDRPRVLPGKVRELPLPRLSARLIDIAHAEVPGLWIGLCADGSIVRFDQTWTGADVVLQIDIPSEADHEPFVGHELRPRLHVSRSGRCVAVVNDYGRFGVVADLVSGATTMSLDGGEYHPETVPFSLSFTSEAGADVLVHRTAWNRLDLSDPLTGELLTARSPTSYTSGEDRPEHYLDYFHGRLLVSPDGDRILDDGWVWHPIGVPETWDVRRWLTENPWESEDGPTKRALSGRDYYWDHGMCWLDNRRVAIEGIGEDDDWMIDGARVFDVTQPGKADRLRWPGATEVTQLAGPRGTFFGAGSDLISCDESGTTVWDVESGTRSATIPRFVPGYQDRVAGELIQLGESSIRVWSYHP